MLHNGSVLPSGQVVEFIREARIDAAGNWAALVFPFGSGFPSGGLIIRNGVEVLGPGSVMAGGEVVADISRFDLGPGGALGVAWKTGAATIAALDQTVILRSGQIISAPGLPAGTVVQEVWGIRVAAPFAMLQVRLIVPGLGMRFGSLHMDCSVVTAPVILQALVQGDAIAGVGEFVSGVDFRGSLSLTSDGAYAMDIRARDAQQAVVNAVMTESGAVAATGQPTPSAGTNWETYFPQVHTLGIGQVAVSTAIRDTTSLDLFGAFFGPGGEIMRSGDAVPGAPSLNVGFFLVARMERNPLTQELVCLLPVESAGTFLRDVLWYGGEILFDEASDTVLGQSINFYDMDLGGGGETVLLQAHHPQWVQGIILVERSVGLTVACPANPNSTGAVGQLTGEGSSYVAASDLVLRATDLPPGQFGLLLTAQAQGLLLNPGNSHGNLCLGGAIGRFNSLVQASNAGGQIEFALDLNALPTPSISMAATAGQTWFFQAWHRDMTPYGKP